MNKDLLKNKILSEISKSSFVYAPYHGWWDDADIEEDLEDLSRYFVNQISMPYDISAQ